LAPSSFGEPSLVDREISRWFPLFLLREMQALTLIWSIIDERWFSMKYAGLRFPSVQFRSKSLLPKNRPVSSLFPDNAARMTDEKEIATTPTLDPDTVIGCLLPPASNKVRDICQRSPPPPLLAALRARKVKPLGFSRQPLHSRLLNNFFSFFVATQDSIHPPLFPSSLDEEELLVFAYRYTLQHLATPQGNGLRG